MEELKGKHDAELEEVAIRVPSPMPRVFFGGLAGLVVAETFRLSTGVCIALGATLAYLMWYLFVWSSGYRVTQQPEPSLQVISFARGALATLAFVAASTVIVVHAEGFPRLLEAILQYLLSSQ